MSDALPEPPELDPAALAGASFSRSRKGFEPAEVRALLGRAADALRVHATRDELLTRQLEDLSSRVESAEHLDEAKVTEMLGAETARIVTAARQAAAEIRQAAETESAALLESSKSEAESTAERLVSEATADRQRAASARESAEKSASEIVGGATASAEATIADANAEAEATLASARAEAAGATEAAATEAERLRSEAQTRHDELIASAGSVHAERTAEAEAAAAEIKARADAELADARSDADQLRADALAGAGAELDKAKAEGREMVAEAKAVRQRMLRDLAERSRAARQKVEAAQAARAGIVDAIRAASSHLDGTLSDLDDGDASIRMVADAAAAAVPDDVETMTRELEDELDAAARGRSGALSAVEDTASDDPVSDDPASDDPVSVGAVPDDDAAGSETAEDGAPGDGDGDAGDSAENATEDVTESGGADAEGAGGEDGDDASGEEMASVHDLFERLRAGEPGSGGDADDPGSSGAVALAAPPRAVTDLTDMGVDVAPAGADAASAEAGRSGDADTTEDAESPEDAEPQGDTALLDRRDELLAPAERLLARNLKRLVGDEQNEVLDRARRVKKGRPELDELIPSDGQAERFAAALAEPYQLAAAAGAQMWAELTGTSVPELDPEVLDDTLVARVSDLLDLRRVHIRESLEQHDRSGDDADGLVGRLRAAYRELRSTSVPELAADLAAAAYNAGTKAAADDDATWRWVPDNGGLPCADAEDNALGGPTACGAEFPTGDLVPPAHPGCRCILVPADAAT